MTIETMEVHDLTTLFPPKDKVDPFTIVLEAIWPFRVAFATIWTDFDIDYAQYRITLNVRLFGGYGYEFVTETDTWKMADDYRRETDRMMRDLAQQWYHRDTHPRSSNICLGEN